MTHGGALDGIRVIDVSGTIAAGYCGKLFADLGAEVLLVEPPEGFPTRRVPPFAPGVDAPEASGMHAYLSANKRSVVFSGQHELRALIRGASLVIDHGIGTDRPVPADTLADASPEAVLLSITWFGQDGPYRDFAGSDGVCMALTSQIDWLGEKGGPPIIPGGYHAQMVGGLTGFIAAMGQVLARDLGNASGVTHVDVSIYEASFCFSELEAMRAHSGLPIRTRIGINRFRSTYPLGIYPCRDGWLGVTTLTPGQWESLCQLLGLEHLTKVEKYREGLSRLEDADILDPLIAERVKAHSATELARMGQRMRIPLSIVPTMEQLFDVDQYVSRGSFADVTHPDLGTVRFPVTPFRLYEAPAKQGGPVSRLGADTEAVLAEAGVPR